MILNDFVIMKFTVEIEEETLGQLMKMTGVQKKGPAVVKAATEYLKRELSRQFATKVMEGEFDDYPLTNDEIEGIER